MTHTGEHLEATAQLERARTSLGEALGQTQDISNSGVDVEHISASLAKAIKNIFAIQSNGLASRLSVTKINQSMDYLRETLMMLQDVRSDNSSLARITGSVAHILALLYPVSKLLNEIGEQEESPIPLTQPSRPPPEDRRSFKRKSIKVDIGIHSDTNFFAGFSQDISSGGLFVATYDVLLIGTKLNVNFSLPNGPVLSLDGIVRWVREYNETTPDIEPGMGIRFDDLRKKDRKAINKYIAQNPPIFYDDD
ncbi:MAG: TIGR02266 family protein [Proteobacteria bacterium]|nr:TIGR02266 family protein [Pseudomonadota bacterium]